LPSIATASSIPARTAVSSDPIKKGLHPLDMTVVDADIRLFVRLGRAIFL